MGLVYEGLFPSFLITFREALEAALIVAIMVSYLRKVGRAELNRYAYLGSGAAVAVSLVLGLIVQRVYGGLRGVAAEVFEGVASLTAVVVLTYMIFWMAGHARRIRGELQRRIDVVITTGELLGIGALAFVAVFREGVETVLFLTAAFLQDPSGVVVGVVAGVVLVLALAALLMRGTYQLDIGKFFKVTSVLLIIFAAGLAGYGVHELMEAGEDFGVEFGVLGQSAYDINPPATPDGSYPMLHEKGAVGSVLKALVGYDGDPEWLRVIVYLGYWLVVGTFVLKTYWKG
ncbi:MAG: FTR1 family protein [Candidatus Bathyarchaeia archaeon]